LNSRKRRRSFPERNRKSISSPLWRLATLILLSYRGLPFYEYPQEASWSDPGAVFPFSFSPFLGDLFSPSTTSSLFRTHVVFCFLVLGETSPFLGFFHPWAFQRLQFLIWQGKRQSFRTLGDPCSFGRPSPKIGLSVYPINRGSIFCHRGFWLRLKIRSKAIWSNNEKVPRPQ